MKRLIVFLSIIMASVTAMAQDGDVVTKRFRVDGNCGECKQRIEAAAFVKGVKKAEWDKKTDTLTVTYRTSKTTEDQILQSVAKAGHQSEKFEASEKAYNKLPSCCKYKTSTCEH